VSIEAHNFKMLATLPMSTMCKQSRIKLTSTVNHHESIREKTEEALWNDIDGEACLLDDSHKSANIK
jgi:hypothetical protein